VFYEYNTIGKPVEGYTYVMEILRTLCHKYSALFVSDFHPASWNPAWSVATILTGLLSFMCNYIHILPSEIKNAMTHFCEWYD
jgi:ubiquitin-protein ligase